MLEYIPVDDAILPAILGNSRLARNMDKVRRGAVNIASNFLATLRLPGFRERALASPHPRLPQLLHAIGDAELINDDDRTTAS